MTPHKWTQEEKDAVRKLWMGGKSAGQIAALTSHSRNSIVGLVRRMGLKGRVYGEPYKRSSRPKIEPMRSEKTLGSCEESGHIREDGKDLSEIGQRDCKFSVTPHNARKHLFCGREVANGSPYCHHHRKVCAAPPRPPIEV